MFWRLLVVCSLAAAVSLGQGMPAAAKNPDLSYWYKNISESSAPEEPGADDFAHEIAVVGNTVHVIWITLKTDWSGYQLYYRRSLDGGQTWQPKQLLFEHASLDYERRYKRLAVSGNVVHIAVNYSAGSGGEWYYVLGYLRSTNNGASFENLRILFNSYVEHTQYAWRVLDIFTVVSEGKLTIGMRDQCNWLVNNSYFIFNSNDDGATFSRRTVYSTSSGSGWAVHDLQRIGNNIYVLYTDAYYYYGLIYSNLFLAASDNAGDSFTVNLISVPSQDGNHKTLAVQDGNYVPKIAGVGNYAVVVWNGLNETDTERIFYRYTTNVRNWSSAIDLSSGLTGVKFQGGQETVAMAQNYAYVLFLTEGGQLYTRASNNYGAAFGDLRELTSANSGGLATTTWWPVVVADPGDPTGRTVRVLGNGGLYWVSQNGGSSFTKPEVVCPIFISNFHEKPRLAASGPLTHFIFLSKFALGGWWDYDVFYRRLAPAANPSGNYNSLWLTTDYDAGRYDNMQVPASSSLNFTTALTVELWVKPAPGGVGTGGTDYKKPIILKYGTNYGDPIFSLATDQTLAGRRPLADLKTASGQHQIVPSNPALTIPDNVWSHLALTYSAGGGANNFKLYLNGELIGAATVTGNIVINDAPIFIGRFGNWEVAEARLWNVARTQAQLQSTMRTRLTGSEAGLMAYYTFGNTTKDLSGNGNDGILMFKESYGWQTIISGPTSLPGSALAPLLLD